LRNCNKHGNSISFCQTRSHNFPIC